MSDGGGKGGFAEEAMGFALAHYLKWVQRTNRFVVEPSDLAAGLIRECVENAQAHHDVQVGIGLADAANDRE